MLMKQHNGFGINKHMTYIFHKTVANYKHFLEIQTSLGKVTEIKSIQFYLKEGNSLDLIET